MTNITNTQRAARGSRAYESLAHDDNDTVTNVADLICDLLHFADATDDKPSGPGYDFADPTRESAGNYAARLALLHYEAERAES